jgi:hypothetical protein
MPLCNLRIFVQEFPSNDPGPHYQRDQLLRGRCQVLQVGDRHQYGPPNVECDLGSCHSTLEWCQDVPLHNRLRCKHPAGFVEGNINPVVVLDEGGDK